MVGAAHEMTRPASPPPPSNNSARRPHGEDMGAEGDDLPEVLTFRPLPWSPPTLAAIKAQPLVGRRESLLTRQLHSENEHTDDETLPGLHTSRTHSTWSNPSVASTAELTSDDGHSVTSPSVSPPFPATHTANALPLHVKPLEGKVKIVGQDEAPALAQPASTEKAVEAGLGRKRCITFACRGKQEAKPATTTTSDPTDSTVATVGTNDQPTQRKCSLKFVCPSRPNTETKPAEKPAFKRAMSPPPPVRRTSASAKALAGKVHRGSDSTITHPSPRAHRRTPSASAATPTPTTVAPERKPLQRKYSTDSEESEEEDEPVRFHDFAPSENETVGWVKESTCHRSRLTVNDTLRKENVIRKACEEVEEEAVEEDEEAEEELDAGLDDDEDVDLDLDEDADELDEDVDEGDDESDDGFHSDDEEGFANSEDEESDSDFEWWKPGGLSTAATSVDQLDRMAIVNSSQIEPGSSIGSGSSGRMSPRHKIRDRRDAQTPAVPIQRSASPDLPDSTDFVCGTLDEDRPIEQAYINRRKIREAAKHTVRPQDFDPTFPTSDPEMDEEDDEDLIDPEESERNDELFHGELDGMHGKAFARKTSTRGRDRSDSQRSPPPAPRYHSPAPKKKSICRSPAPRKLFGHSPRRMRSPAPGMARVMSPPNSPTEHNHQLSTAPHLGQRAQPTRTASLPRRGVNFTISKMGQRSSDNSNSGNESDTTAIASPSPHHRRHQPRHRSDDGALGPKKRGAIDIVKGLDKKRQHRKEKLYQKMCAAKAAGKNVGPAAPPKVKPGRGYERMKAIGLQLQNYHGKAEHILSL